MKSARSLAFTAVLVLGVLGRLAAQDPGVLDFLPRSPIPGGWAPDGEAQEFKGEDLFVYIDGGADIYHEYGFVAVAVQDYRNPAGKTVSLEIFEMSDDAAAFGMYAFKTTGKGKSVGLGDGGELEEYYLNFHKGRYVLTLTGFDGSAETVRGLREVAGAADAALLGKKGTRPALVESLPQASGFVPGSVKFVRGRLGLNNILPAASGARINFTSGVRAVYGSGELIILDCGGEAEATKAFESLGPVLREPGSGRAPIRTALCRGLILITAGIEPAESDALMDAARSKLSRPTGGPA